MKTETKVLSAIGLLSIGLLAWQPISHQIDVWKLESSAKDDPIMNQEAPKPSATTVEPVKTVVEPQKQAQNQPIATQTVQTTAQPTNTPQNANNGVDVATSQPDSNHITTVQGVKFKFASNTPGMIPPKETENGAYWKSDKSEIFQRDGDIWYSLNMPVYGDIRKDVEARFSNCHPGAVEQMDGDSANNTFGVHMRNCN